MIDTIELIRHHLKVNVDLEKLYLSIYLFIYYKKCLFCALIQKLSTAALYIFVCRLRLKYTFNSWWRYSVYTRYSLANVTTAKVSHSYYTTMLDPTSQKVTR